MQSGAEKEILVLLFSWRPLDEYLYLEVMKTFSVNLWASGPIQIVWVEK